MMLQWNIITYIKYQQQNIKLYKQTNNNTKIETMTITTTIVSHKQQPKPQEHSMKNNTKLKQ